MADSEAPISPFWSKAKIVLGFAPIVAALSTSIVSLVKAYDQTGPKAVYEALGRKTEENSAAIQDTHSDVKAIWAYLNGMNVGRVSTIASATSTETSTSTTKTPSAPPKVATFYKPKKTEPLSIEEVVGAEEVTKSVPIQPIEHFNMADQSAPRLVSVLPEISPAPSATKLPSFEQVISDSKK
jgi:hypothetical protein